MHHVNKRKDKNRRIMSIVTEKALEKVQHLFMIKTLRKVGVEGAYINIIKAIYEKLTANIILSGKILRSFPLRLVTRKGCLLSQILFNIVWEVLATVISEGKDKKNHTNWKGGSNDVIVCR